MTYGMLLPDKSGSPWGFGCLSCADNFHWMLKCLRRRAADLRQLLSRIGFLAPTFEIAYNQNVALASSMMNTHYDYPKIQERYGI